MNVKINGVEYTEVKRNSDGSSISYRAAYSAQGQFGPKRTTKKGEYHWRVLDRKLPKKEK